MRVEQQLHAYVNGHELLAASLKLSAKDQESIDRLSDVAGALGPGERCPPYLTGYPLPSRTHFVLARTWYDDAAPRAGCVLTHSLLVSMEDWRGLTGLQPLRDAFTFFDKAQQPRKVAPLVVAENAGSASLPTVLAPERFALVEAIFLEHRVPIVTFDCEDAENAALRIVQAVWPGLRETFAFCTFTLQPRSVNGRDFDLLFGPGKARARFANWSGRRIDSQSAQARQARHRWSELLVRSIFEATTPSVIADDPLGILRLDSRGDSGRLRLALLWQDLRQREGDSPSAVLGMLDVLVSMHLERREFCERAEPLIISGAERASNEMRAGEGLSFLGLLVGKLGSTRPRKEMLAAIEAAAFRLASADSSAAITAVPFESSTSLGARTIARGIGDALAQLPSLRLLDLLGVAPYDVVSRLLDASPSFCRAAVPRASSAPPEWWSTLAAILMAAPLTEKRRLRRRLLPFLRDSAHASLVKPLLSTVSTREIGQNLATLLRGASGADASSFEHALVDVLVPAHREALLEAIVQLPADIQLPERALLNVLRPTRNDLSLLVTSGRIDRVRRPALVAQFLENLSDWELEQLSREAHDLIEHAIGLLTSESPPLAPRQIARILGSLPIQTGSVREIALRIVDALDPSDVLPLISAVFPRLLKMSVLSDLPLVSALLNRSAAIEAFRVMGSERLLDMLIPSQRGAFDGERQSVVLKLVGSSPHQLRKVLLERVEELARRLASRGQDELAPAALSVWAQLLDEARDEKARNALRAFAVSLHYALERHPPGGSTLVLASFPFVYAAACSKEPSVEVESLFSFFDWDRAKTLRAELVAAYLCSDWPPEDLMLLAERCDIGRQVLKRIAQEHGGREYIQRMRETLHTRPDAPARAAHDAILDFELNPPGWYEWD